MKRVLFCWVATVVLAATQTYAGVFTANFDECVTLPCNPPTGSSVYGAAGGGVIEPTGGFNNTGVLKLTKAINGQQSANDTAAAVQQLADAALANAAR